MVLQNNFCNYFTAFNKIIFKTILRSHARRQLITGLCFSKCGSFVVQFSKIMEAKQALEIEYTPSLFSKRFGNRDELIANYIEFTSKGRMILMK